MPNFNPGLHLANLCLLYINLYLSHWLNTWFKSFGRLQFSGFPLSYLWLWYWSWHHYFSHCLKDFFSWMILLDNTKFVYTNTGLYLHGFVWALKMITYSNAFMPKECLICVANSTKMNWKSCDFKGIESGKC